MFKNSVLLKSVDTKLWLVNAGIRALKTFAQTLVGFTVVGLSISDIDWSFALSVSVVAMISSILTSIAGIPECKAKEGE